MLLVGALGEVLQQYGAAERVTDEDHLLIDRLQLPLNPIPPGLVVGIVSVASPG